MIDDVEAQQHRLLDPKPPKMFNLQILQGLKQHILLCFSPFAPFHNNHFCAAAHALRKASRGKVTTAQT
jgi:hypothetical protein